MQEMHYTIAPNKGKRQAAGERRARRRADGTEGEEAAGVKQEDGGSSHLNPSQGPGKPITNRWRGAFPERA